MPRSIPITIIEVVKGYRYVLVPVQRENARTKYPPPNYLGTGLGLAGVVPPNESLKDFLDRLKVKKGVYKFNISIKSK